MANTLDGPGHVDAATAAAFLDDLRALADPAPGGACALATLGPFTVVVESRSAQARGPGRVVAEVDALHLADEYSIAATVDALGALLTAALGPAPPLSAGSRTWHWPARRCPVRLAVRAGARPGVAIEIDAPAGPATAGR